MKKILFIVCLFISAVAFSQPGYNQFNERRNQLALQARALGLPTMGTPAIQTGQTIMSGQIIYDSTGGNKGIHVWNGSTWVRMVDTTMTAFLSGTASNGITKVVNDFQLGGTLAAYTRIIGGNNVFEFTGMGYGSRFTATPRTGGTMGTMTFSNSNGTDSAFLNIQGRTAGASNREIHFGINHTASSAIMELYFKNVAGTAPYAALTYNDPIRSTYAFVDSSKVYLSKQIVGVNRSTALDLYNDSTSWYHGGTFGPRTSEMLIRNGYQDSWATDSVRWRLGDRSASLTFNSDGWHAWQTLGEYYFYNVARETDSTGLDFLVYDRADQEMKRFPSDLFWGAGGGGGVTTMAAIGSTPNANGATIAGSTLNLEPANGSFGGVVTTGTQTFAGGKTFIAQSFFSAGASVSGAYSTNAGMNLSYISGSNLGRIVMYDGGYKNFEVIAQEVTMYGGGSNPGVLINGSGNVVMGSSTAADATEKLTVTGNVRFSGALMPNNAAGTSGQILQSAGAGAPPTWVSTSTTVTIPISKLLAAIGTNSIDNGNFGQTWEWNTLNGNGLILSSTSSAVAGPSALIRTDFSGTNASGGHSTYGGFFGNSRDGATSSTYGVYGQASGGTTNYGIQGQASGGTTAIGGNFTVSGASNNYAVLANGGNSGFNTGAPNSMLHVNGSFATAYRALTALRTLDGTDHTIEVTANTFTVTLPTAVGITGRQYVITNSGAGTTTIATTSSQTFINVTSTPVTLTLNQFSTVTVVSNGANWLRTSSL